MHDKLIFRKLKLLTFQSLTSMLYGTKTEEFVQLDDLAEEA